MKVLITGGAGFIGSNLTQALLNDDKVTSVRVLDNLVTGHRKNLAEFADNPKFELIEGDIRNREDCDKACEGIDAISHQAALGSVPRSISDPVTTHEVNVDGFINMLEAARHAGIRRMVYASSSAVYGTLAESPKVEDRVEKVLSPYAAGKMCNELYAEAYARNYNMQLIGFRYFNVFGPKQDPFGPYAAVIPLFIKHALQNTSPTINGDGTITRDFTPVSNVIQVNIKGLFLNDNANYHQVLNVACGHTIDLNAIWSLIKDITGATAEAIHGPDRPGDIKFSLANITKAKELLGYEENGDLLTSLREAVTYYRNVSIKQQ